MHQHKVQNKKNPELNQRNINGFNAQINKSNLHRESHESQDAMRYGHIASCHGA